MDIIKLIYPGLGLSCTVLLFILGLFQLKLYLKKGYERSKSLAAFCFLTSLFAFNITVVYSGSFSDNFTRFYVEGLQWVLFLSFYFYLKSLSYFIAIPKLLKKIYSISMLSFASAFTLAYLWHLITGQYLYFDPNVKSLPINSFVDVYINRLGTPNQIPLLLISASGLLNIALTSVVLFRLKKSSNDIWLMAGMGFTIFASAMDIVLLPIAPNLYVPLLFLSNISEAARMSFLATYEDYIETATKIHETEKEIRQSQHNLAISEERLINLSLELTNLMKEERLFKNPLLKIDILARKLRVPSYIVTQVIRFGLETNFYSLVSEYRINYVKENLKLKSRSEDSILEIATEAGFNSKSTFNQAFKKLTGQTPSEFRKTIQV